MCQDDAGIINGPTTITSRRVITVENEDGQNNNNKKRPDELTVE